jgi:hypothetical protein
MPSWPRITATDSMTQRRAACRALSRSMPAGEDSRLRELALAVFAVGAAVQFDGLRISRTSGQHGTGGVQGAGGVTLGFDHRVLDGGPRGTSVASVAPLLVHS